MRIPDSLLKCVTFIGREEDGAIKYRGTGFFVIIEHEEDGRPWNFAYLVTAKHVAEAVKGSIFYVRANMRGTNSAGDIPMNLNPERPTRRYTHPSDRTADVAVTPVLIPEEVDALCLPGNMILTETKREELNIGIGDEIFIIGLFSFLKGRTRNIPVSRTGNIAMFPDEGIPVQDHRGQRTEIDGIVIEARSIGGLSGSPVLARHSFNIEGFRHKETSTPLIVTAYGSQFHLLGLVLSHWDADPTAFNQPEPKMIRGGVNFGLAVVVPASKLMETLQCEALSQMRTAAAKLEAEKQKKQAGGASIDA